MIRYVKRKKKRCAPETGVYESFDIVAFDCAKLQTAAIIEDVSPDRKLAARIVRTLNRYRIPLVHMEDIVCDALP